ncbi:hypothetical protein AVEN_117570-1 [Araneus ventricosus]|uniref:Uncharacterized protein n=1 Tax=Araneus ventricosus TaxID=182803 RepID=A0A4Y2IX01_ARAVE|nr:hypothetical protein AVEN_117570-1 [Araneus ventricosus]
MSGLKLKRNVLNVKQELEILQELDNRESASTDAEDALNEGNITSHSAAPQSVGTLLDYMGRRGFDCGDITAVRQICVDIQQEMNKQQKQRRIADFLSSNFLSSSNSPSLMLYSIQIHGNKVFPVCAKCGVASASPENILSCLRLSRETFGTDPLLALDFLRVSGLMDDV